MLVIFCEIEPKPVAKSLEPRLYCGEDCSVYLFLLNICIRTCIIIMISQVSTFSYTSTLPTYLDTYCIICDVARAGIGNSPGYPLSFEIHASAFVIVRVLLQVDKVHFVSSLCIYYRKLETLTRIGFSNSGQYQPT